MLVVDDNHDSALSMVILLAYAGTKPGAPMTGRLPLSFAAEMLVAMTGYGQDEDRRLTQGLIIIW